MNSQNPLAGLVPHLAPPADPPPAAHRWAVVASTEPLRIRHADEEAPADVTPLTLVPPAQLTVGARVLVLQLGHQDTILGMAQPTTSPAAPPPTA